MSQQFLDRPDVRAPLQEMRCEAVPQNLCALITLVNPTRRAATLIALSTTAGST